MTSNLRVPPFWVEFCSKSVGQNPNSVELCGSSVGKLGLSLEKARPDCTRGYEIRSGTALELSL